MLELASSLHSFGLARLKMKELICVLNLQNHNHLEEGSSICYYPPIVPVRAYININNERGSINSYMLSLRYWVINRSSSISCFKESVVQVLLHKLNTL